MKKSNGKTRANVSNEDFVKAWRNAAYTNDVVAAIGLKRGSIYTRAKKLREAGVKLPALARRGRGPSVIDVKALNALLK